MELSAPELKFLLRLLEHPPHYRSPLPQLKPDAKTSAAECDRTCRCLQAKGLIEYAVEIQRYRTTTAGKVLLNLDMGVRPVTPDEHQMLKVAATAAATPSQAKRVSSLDRQRVLQRLAARGLVSIGKQQITEAWLTPAGHRYLRDSYTPGRTPAVIPLGMLGSYLAFLRQFLEPSASASEHLSAPEESFPGAPSHRGR